MPNLNKRPQNASRVRYESFRNFCTNVFLANQHSVLTKDKYASSTSYWVISDSSGLFQVAACIGVFLHA
jgi:hypothetical protein